MKDKKTYLLTKEVAQKKMRRMAYEILEKNINEDGIILAGIRESGSAVARTIQSILSEISEIRTELIALSLDKKKPNAVKVSKQIDFNDKVIIVVDDVANSGKTILYALKAFLDFHPKKIQTLVLVERSHKAFPVHADFVGLSVATTVLEHIIVEVDGDTVIGAYLK